MQNLQIQIFEFSAENCGLQAMHRFSVENRGFRVANGGLSAENRRFRPVAHLNLQKTADSRL